MYLANPFLPGGPSHLDTFDPKPDARQADGQVHPHPLDRLHNFIDCFILAKPFEAGCNAGTCHGTASGQNGFKLSLRGYDPEFDCQATINELSGRGFKRVILGNYLMLRKPTVPKPGSHEYRLLRHWIVEGMEFVKFWANKWADLPQPDRRFRPAVESGIARCAGVCASTALSAIIILTKSRPSRTTTREDRVWS